MKAQPHTACAFDVIPPLFEAADAGGEALPFHFSRERLLPGDVVLRLKMETQSPPKDDGRFPYLFRVKTGQAALKKRRVLFTPPPRRLPSSFVLCPSPFSAYCREMCTFLDPVRGFKREVG